MRGRVVVVGASAAGVAACAGLRAAGYDGEIVLVGEEPHAPYERPPLSKQLLCGGVEAEGVGLPAARRLAEANVIQRLGCRATRLDVASAVVELEHREELAFDGMVIATGSTARRLPGQPRARGVHVLRTLDHALALRSELAGARHVAVIGAGFIGLEVAASVRSLGVAVTVVESAAAPLARVLGADVGARFPELHETRGVDVRCGVAVAELAGRSDDAKPADQVPSFWSDQYDVKVMTVGWLAGYDEVRELPEGDAGLGILFGREGRLVAAMGWNAPAFVARQRKAVAAGSPLA